MQLQMTTDYALRILVYLASAKSVISSTELAEKLDIPAKYVLRVGNKLKVNGFVETITGSKGGYNINKPLADISVYDVVVAFEGSIKLNRGLEEDGSYTRDAVHDFFMEAQQQLESKLKVETVETLLTKV